MIRNKVYIPFSFFSLVLIDNNKGKEFTSSNYEPDAFYCIDGETVLHKQVKNFKNLEFLLNHYV